MKSVGAGMTETSVPKRDIGMESNRTAIRHRTAWVEIIGGITSVQNPPGASILDRETKSVKVNSDMCLHTNTSPCTSNTEDDAPQLPSKETRPETRYASNPTGAFEDPKPYTPGRDPVWAHSGYGLP